MKGPKKPILRKGFMIVFYECPYCGLQFTKEYIQRHIRKCFKEHRERVRKIYSERAKRTFMEGKTLKHIKRKGSNSGSTQNKEKDK